MFTILWSYNVNGYLQRLFNVQELEVEEIRIQDTPFGTFEFCHYFPLDLAMEITPLSLA